MKTTCSCEQVNKFGKFESVSECAGAFNAFEGDLAIGYSELTSYYDVVTRLDLTRQL